MPAETDSTPKRLLKTLARIEDGILALLLSVMICLALLQIFLRNFFQYGLPDGDHLLRILVLWVALFGAIVASRERKNISIDILSRYLNARARTMAGVVVDLFVVLVAALFAYHSGRLVMDEYTLGTLVLGGVPSWLVQLIIPFAFTVITFRYLTFSLMHVRELRRGSQQG